jgi:hypothetical protein
LLALILFQTPTVGSEPVATKHVTDRLTVAELKADLRADSASKT